MVHIKQIDQAIAAHGYWKEYLRNAIKTGQIDTSVETIRSDNQCIFGQWLDSSILTPMEEASPHYKTVKERHAEFHRTAACVVDLVLAGRKDDAERMMSLGGSMLRYPQSLPQP